MNAAQQSALEALAGRTMTTAEIAMANGRADGALARSLSTNRTLQGIVPTPVFANWCSSTGLRAVIEDTSKNLTSPLRSGALAVLDLLKWGSLGLDLSASPLGQSNIAMLAAWAAASIVTPTQISALVALAANSAALDINTISNILSGN